jgi:hypothetical protein
LLVVQHFFIRCRTAALWLCYRGCFADWWCWQQQALAEQQQQLEQRTGATAAAALVQVRFLGISCA